MKSKKKYIAIIIILLFLLVPFRIFHLKDGGSVEFKAFLWSVTKVHQLIGEDASINAGWRIKILGKTVYERTGSLYIKGEEPFAQGDSDDTMLHDHRPMVMVCGEIFVDAGKKLAVEIDPSEVLGEITSSVTQDRSPTKDGQSNFGCVGSQFAYYEEGLVVLINNEWYLFERDDSSAFTVGDANNPESATASIRTDVCELYLKVLEDLWNVDSGLNGGISRIGIDLSDLSHLTELEKEEVMQAFASKHNLPFITGTWEELCEQGYIDKDNLYWEDGLFFSIKTNGDAEWNLPYIKEGDEDPELTAFDAYKWRSGLGAYFFGQCTAQKNADGKWSYTVGEEAIS